MKHKEGHWVWVLYNGKTISWNSENQPTKVIGTLMGISEMVDFKKELTEQQKRFEIAANITSDVIWEWRPKQNKVWWRSEEHTSELQSRGHLVCRLLLEKKKKYKR